MKAENHASSPLLIHLLIFLRWNSPHCVVIHIFIVLYRMFLKGRDHVSLSLSAASSQLPAWFFMDAQQIIIVSNWIYIPYSPTTRKVAATKLTIFLTISCTVKTLLIVTCSDPQNTAISQLLAYVLRIFSCSSHIWPPLLQPTYWYHDYCVQSGSKNWKRLVIPLKQVHLDRLWSREE